MKYEVGALINMLFLLIGLVLIPLKIFNIFEVGHWPWLWVLAPFGLTVIWWTVFNPFSRVGRKLAEKELKKRKDKLDKEKLERLGYSNTEIKEIQKRQHKPNQTKDESFGNKDYYDS